MFSGNNFLPPARIWISDDESVRVFMAAGAAEVAEGAECVCAFGKVAQTSLLHPFRVEGGSSA